MNTKFSQIAIVGAPNAGKSTLVNYLVGQKVSIVSPKVQTTRSILRGIMVEGDAQIVFIDTPGIFVPKKKRSLERAIAKCAWSELRESDNVCLIVDAKNGLTNEIRAIAQDIKDHGKRAILLINKVDVAGDKNTFLIAEEMNKYEIFDEIFPISAKTGRGVDRLKQYLVENAPKGLWMYKEDEITDAPMRFLASEITREKLFLHLSKELPYSITVETESWENLPSGTAKINQIIYVTRDSQKGIVLGRKGAMIKKIGEESRKDIEEMIGGKVHLTLFVKIKEDWTLDREQYEYMGLQKPSMK